MADQQLTPTWESTYSPEEKYSEGILSQAKAFGLGALRSASFGLSDEFLTQTGAISPEDLKAYKEYNPDITTAGEVTGVLGALAAPEAGLLGVASAPTRLVSGAGQAVSRAVLPAAETAAGLIASKATSPVINRILGQAAAVGAGSAVEGAAVGAGQLLSEHALGDTDLNGENIIASLGSGALTGAAVGSLFGSLKGGIEAKFPKFISEVDQKAIQDGDWKAIAENSDLPTTQKESLIAGLSKKKKNATEIEQAAADIGAPVLPSMVSDSPLVQRAESSLINGSASIPGMKAAQVATDGLKRAEQAAEDVLSNAGSATKAELGDSLKSMVAGTVEKQVKPINEIYDALKTKFQSIAGDAEEISAAANSIRNLEEVPLSPQAKAIASSAADRLESVKTIDDVKRLRSILNQELGLSATPIQKRTTAIIADKLAQLEENGIVKFAEKEAKTGTEKEGILSLLEQRKEANKQYSVFKDKIERLGEVLGRKKIHGASDFLDFIDNLTPEKIADKLSNKNNSEFLNWFSKEMPEGMQAISNYQKNILRDQATKDGILNTNTFLRNVNKLPKEYASKIFTPEELKKISALNTYMDAFPKNFNPSNTDNMRAFRAGFEGISGMAFSNVRDYAIKGFIDAAAAGGDKTKRFVDSLATIERTAQKTARSIKSGVSDIFSGTYIPSTATRVLNKQERRELHDRDGKKISEMSAPEKMMEHLTKNTDTLYQIAPQTAAAVQGTMVRATQFLQSKLPTGGEQKPLSAAYKPSDAEISKWYKYFNVVQNPTSVLKEVANGTVTKESMETLNVVYPKLLQDMRVQVMDKMTDSIAKKKPIPYKTKMSLSLFLDSDLINSLNPKSMLANQNTLASAQTAHDAMQQQASVKKDSSNLDKSNRILTSFQSNSQRQEA